MNPLAEELNKILDQTVAERLLSDTGKRMYFPKGLLTQCAEADERAHRYNATIGMAYEGGEIMILDAIRESLPGLPPYEAVSYAPTLGVSELRKAWKRELERKNPSLRGLALSPPVVVPGLTAAISYVSDLFLDPEDIVVLPDLNWPNYRLIFEERRQASCLTFPIFASPDKGGGFNVRGLEASLREAAARSLSAKGAAKAACVLNFPNNPTGYTPTESEAREIAAALKRIADEGTDLLVICDDAYFGLCYEDGLYPESIFALLAGAHERILAVKADGPTKEDFVWGFRLGFLTFGSAGLGSAQHEALVKKLGGVIRSSVSNSTRPGQQLLLKAMDYPGYEEQKAKYREILHARYRRVRSFLKARSLPAGLRPLPFNSGYFMSFACEGFSAEALRVRLLETRGIGTVSLQDKYLRVAYSSVETEDLDELFAEIVEAAADLSA